MNQQQKQLVEKLNTLVHTLGTESAAYLDSLEDHQLWYNRGYADGVARALQELELTQTNHAILSPQELAQHRWMPWGKAYQHGNDKGYQEAYEVLALKPSSSKQTT